MPTGVFGKEPGGCVITVRIRRAENLSLVARPASPWSCALSEEVRPLLQLGLLSGCHSLPLNTPAQLRAI